MWTDTSVSSDGARQFHGGWWPVQAKGKKGKKWSHSVCHRVTHTGGRKKGSHTDTRWVVHASTCRLQISEINLSSGKDEITVGTKRLCRYETKLLIEWQSEI